VNAAAGSAGGHGGHDETQHNPASHPFDVGLQPERTALAWRRTALALIVAAVVGIRVLPALLGPWVLIPAGAGIAIAVAVLVASHRRYCVQHERLTKAGIARIPLLDGALPGLMALVTIFAGLACTAIVVSANLP
jgi:uncharacterized membrane protein YidH (DUF202 family)